MKFPLAREGWKFILPPLLLTVLAAATGHPIWAVALGAPTLFLMSFFRDPERRPVAGPEIIVSPADGTILSIGPAAEAPPGAGTRISIFMSVFNVHVNRAPVSGLVADYAYSPGRKLAAFAEKASHENEQNLITLEASGGKVAFKQIAGAIARRIIFYPKPGDPLERAQRIGIILFGSRVDLFVPDGAVVLVRKGEKVRAGLTGLAQWPPPAPGRGGRPPARA
ncbi:MAG: phosphatidylserine decarboxylase [Acidobacteriota bacterium]